MIRLGSTQSSRHQATAPATFCSMCKLYLLIYSLYFSPFRSEKEGDRSIVSSIKGLKTLDDLEDWLSENSKDNSASRKNNNTESRNSLISSSSDMTGTASAWDELYDRLRATGEIDVENGTHV